MTIAARVISTYRRAADFRGRSDLGEIWLFHVWQIAVGIALAVVNYVGLQLTESQAFNLACAYLFLAFIAANTLPVIALMIRRLHDMNRSAVWMLLGPLVLPFVFLVGGSRGPNRFGDAPDGAAVGVA
jgi:uncharacterized membrane protein YhaH (DUF805 family)